jgi:membrane-associated phospholipid phosphatase
MMHDLLMQAVPWGVQFIVALQAHGSAALDALMRAISGLLNESFLLLLAPLLLWHGDKRQMMRVGIFALLSVYVNTALKEVFAIPRPFLVSALVQAKSKATGYAFPSGHAQLSASFWPALALIYRRRWFWWCIAVLIPFVALSRVYLGVHYPQDVAAGLAMGFALVALYVLYEGRIETWCGRQRWGAQLALAVGLPLALWATVRSEDATAAMGLLSGLACGYLIEKARLDVVPRPGVWPTLARTLLGLGIVLVIYMAKALLAMLPPSPLVLALDLLRYVLMGLVFTLGAPWLFVRLRLSTATRGEGEVQR